MQYELHLNLQQRATLRAAILFWEKIKVKDRVEEFFTSRENSDIKGAKTEWHKLTKAILEEWKKDVLPKMLKVELIHIIKMIGETIFNWYQYVKHEYEVEKTPRNCIHKIHWTPYGTVDAVQIFKSSWLDNPNFDISKMYNFACRYVMEDYINYLWNKIPSNIQSFRYNDIYKCFDQHIIAYWSCCRNDNLLNLMRYFDESNLNGEYIEEFDLVYDPSLSIQENMLQLSVHQGYFIATKYFWEKLTEEERNKSVVNCARIAVERHYYYADKDKRIESYKSSQCIEVCIFFMNQMSKYQKQTFFNETLPPNDFSDINEVDVKDEILSMLLSTWPWQELFIPVLEDMLKYQDDHIRMDCRFFNTITNKMAEDHTLGYALETSKYRCLLRQAWLTLPAFIKLKIVEDCVEFELYNLIDVWDIDSLKLILNDPEIASVRDQFIEFGAESYDKLIKNNQFEKLDQLIDEISRSDEEKKQFKQKINNYYSFIIDGQFHLIDKILDWRRSTPEERQSTKNSINHIEFCKEFIEMYDYELLERFLDWKFDTEEEKRKCKDHFKSDIFSIRQICSIWKDWTENINKAMVECSKFLHWFLESEEEIKRFKREMLVTFEDEYIWHTLFQINLYGIIDVFISWCLLDDEQLQRVDQFTQALLQPL